MDNPSRPAGSAKIRYNLTDKVDDKGRIRVEQGIIAGCAGGTYENIMAAAAILEAGGFDDAAGLDGPAGYTGPAGDFSLSVYPGSQPVMLELTRNGGLARLIARGAVIRTAFCGPCFGAGDVPANNSLSIRHTTRNFPNREGSRPGDGQISWVSLMDARSIAATARNHGFLTSAAALAEASAVSLSVPTGIAALEAASLEAAIPPYHYDDSPYRSRVYNGIAAPRPQEALRYGPNITGWPPLEDLGEDLLLRIVSFITDPVTTTDELIPSGETSSYRSNPLALAEFTLSRKDPAYVGRAKALAQAEAARRELVRSGGKTFPEAAALPEFPGVIETIRGLPEGKGLDLKTLRIGSAIYAVKPGDGSAREQAASCQRVLGGRANFAREYATKRYRGNLINWGILPFTVEGEIPGEIPFENGDYVFIPGIAAAIRGEGGLLRAYVIRGDGARAFNLETPALSASEKELLLAGSLINLNRVKGQALTG
jgi:aconitate hydratase